MFSMQIPFVLAAMERALVRYFFNVIGLVATKLVICQKERTKTLVCVYDSLIPAKMITYEESFIRTLQGDSGGALTTEDGTLVGLVSSAGALQCGKVNFFH